MKTEITIDGANAAGNNYIAWAPVRATIRLVEADGAVNPVLVVVRNQNPNQGGQVVFYSAIPSAARNQLQINLPVNGDPVEFFVGGRFRRPSLADNDAVIVAVRVVGGAVLSTKSLMVRIRKNANTLTPAERDRFIRALATLNNSGAGEFALFRDMHRDNTSDEAHGRPGFLPWHRAYLLDLERELQNIDPSVALPYWRFDTVARNLFSRAFIGVSVGGWAQFSPSNPLQFWATDLTPGIFRTPFFNTNTQIATTLSGARVLSEQLTLRLGLPGNVYVNFDDLEGNPHGRAHTCFGGWISSIDTAAKDPLFFLLHCNVDRLWAKWQWFFKRFNFSSTDSYNRQGSATSPGAIRIGHNVEDSMWPWNQDTNLPRPATAPGGSFAPSTATNAPGLTPKVRDMIDYQGVVSRQNNLGFGYDDVPFEFI
jgi:tyrosinase